MDKQYDALLVLGCGLTDDAHEITTLAVKLYNQSISNRIIFSGGLSYKATFNSSKSEAQAMKDFCIDLGVPEANIIIEEKSKDTLGNAYFTKVDILKPLDFKRIAILRGPNHSEDRINYIFNKVLGPDYNIHIIKRSEYRPEENERERKSLVVLKSWFDDVKDGDDENIYKIILKKHPAYSSDPLTAEALKLQIEDA